MTSIGTNNIQAIDSAKIPPDKYDIKGFFYKNSYCRVQDLKNSQLPKYNPDAGIDPNKLIAKPL